MTTDERSLDLFETLDSLQRYHWAHCNDIEPPFSAVPNQVEVRGEEVAVGLADGTWRTYVPN